MSVERSNLADWLYAVDRLEPQSEEWLQSISTLLGLRSKATQKMPSPERTQRSAPEREPRPESTSSHLEQPAPSAKPRRRMASVLTPGNSSRNPAPEWLATAHSLETPGAATIRPPLPLEPLFPAHTSRAILSGALATPSDNGPVDLVRIVELFSRAEALHEIPRVSIPTLVRGVQLLVDMGESMQPFGGDQAVLRAALSQVVGRDRTQVLYFEGSPMWGAGTGSREDWPEYQPPASGTPVVALTDLGIAQPQGVAGLAGVADWRAFAEAVARAGCPLLALVPYPQRRWPPLSKSMTVVQWDRATTAAVVARGIPDGLRIAKVT